MCPSLAPGICRVRLLALMNLGVLILAAGASSRMGRPKLLLPWAGTTILGALLDRWTRLGARQIAVVRAAGGDALAAELGRLQFPAAQVILNPEPERGMFSSIQCAARWDGWDGALTHFCISLGDQPHVREATLRGLLEFAAAHPARFCQPSRGGRGRHPVALPAADFARIAHTTATNLREFRNAPPGRVAMWESDDAGLDLDLDTPADYARALAEFGAGGDSA